MNEELNKALLDVITKVTSGVEGVVAFGQDQIPEVVEQLLLWEMTISLIGFLLGMLSLTIAVFRGIQGEGLRVKYDKAYKEGPLSSDGHDFLRVCSYIIPWCCAIVVFIIIANNLVWIKILVAPKLFLLEYAAKMVGGA